jgi:hypothetical protein
MSRNFELLQRLQTERTGVYDSASTLLVAEEPRLADATVVLSQPAPSDFAERLAREEEMKLVQRLFLQPSSARNHVMVFAGAEPGVGCSETCRRTAEVLAIRVRGKICLLHANSALATDNSVGKFTSSGNAWWRKSARQLRPNLWMVTIGAPVMSSLAQQLLSLREQFDYVLIDSTAVQSNGETGAMAQVADGVVLVIKAGQTRREVVQRALDALRAGNAQVAGIVLNQRTFPVPQSLYERL